MNKKLWVGFLAVFFGTVLTNFLIHQLLLGELYRSAAMANMMRPEAQSMLWVHFVTAAFSSYFFTLIFSKGYMGTGIGEGIRFGLYVGMMMSIPMAYDTYAEMPIPYSLALQWFIYGVIQYIILGVVVAMVFGSKPKGSSTT